MAFALPSLLELLLLAAPFLAPTAPGGGYLPAPDPGPDPSCPDDTRLVTGRHFDDVDHLCNDWRPGPHRCWSYFRDLTVAHGEPTAVRVCMDRFEAPNQRGARPLVMKTYPEAEALCKARGRRVCTEVEWETACESGDERPWFYGWKLDGAVCNTSKAWRKFDAEALAAGGDLERKELERLWQGAPSGDYPACRTDQGIYDMMGNVEEWVRSSRARPFRAALMGGFWAKPWVGCRGTNDAHEPSQFKFYEVGFRCCTEPRSPAPPPSPPPFPSGAP